VTSVDDRFDWDEVGTTIPHQPRTSIYWNKNGQVVIRQEGEVFEDDPYVFFSVESLPRLIEVLQWELGESGYVSATTNRPEGATAAEVQQRPDTRSIPLTNAERQRRFKQRKKGNENNAGNESLVTQDMLALPRAAE
jgi:hypothetical protein